MGTVIYISFVELFNELINSASNDLDSAWNSSSYRK